jgi:glycerol-3-phosphate dehydrogenase
MSVQQGAGRGNSNKGGVQKKIYDLLVIGGGINGAMVARDAVGRGLSVLLVEKDDLASGTSSASSKMIHGGLRYLEHYDFALVRESLREREIMLHSAPHIIQPLRLILPKIKGSRPTWMVLIGLWFYDHLISHISLPRSTRANLKTGPYADGLNENVSEGFAYSDCWTDDARLVVLTALDAANRGADIVTRTRCTKARREGELWHVNLAELHGEEMEIRARAIVNAAGPWAHEVLTGVADGHTKMNLSLIKGSHIIVPPLYTGDHAFLLQNDDGRVVFVIPFEGRFSLIGTTEVVHEDKPGPVKIETHESEYLCKAVNQYFERQITPGDIVWSFAGLRPLFDDGSADPGSISRDYVLEVDQPEGLAPILSIFGGKLTTARQLAESVVDRLKPSFPDLSDPWSETGVLPGGELDDYEGFVENLMSEYPGLEQDYISALARRHGTNVRTILDKAAKVADLGPHFGGTLYGAEVDWLIDKEWAKTVEDVLLRRTKCNLEMSKAGAMALKNYMEKRA